MHTGGAPRGEAPVHFAMAEEDRQESKEPPPTVTQTVIGVVVLLALLLGIVLAALPELRRLLWTEPAAAWVQALGSIAAIATAIWLAHDQARREGEKKEREEHERRVRNTSVALAAVQYIRYVAEGIRGDLAAADASEEVEARNGRMAHRIAALRGFAERLDVAQLENARIAPRYFGILEAVVALDAAYIESPKRALKAVSGVVEICQRFTREFGGIGTHTVREYIYLPEFRDE